MSFPTTPEDPEINLFECDEEKDDDLERENRRRKYEEEFSRRLARSPKYMNMLIEYREEEYQLMKRIRWRNNFKGIFPWNLMIELEDLRLKRGPIIPPVLKMENAHQSARRSHSPSTERSPLLGGIRSRYMTSYTEDNDDGGADKSPIAAAEDATPRSKPSYEKTMHEVNIFESLDYDTMENTIYHKELLSRTTMRNTYICMVRWFIMFLIGVITGLIACLIDFGVSESSGFKFQFIKQQFDNCVKNNCVWLGFLVWIGFSVSFSLIGSLATAFIAPVASGSGIPQIKCFLNGVKVPRVVRLKTLVVKVFGVVCAVAGGLAVGKEGPMIHSGAVVAAGISQGRSSSLKFDLNVLEYFRTDTEKRDFVSGGAAAGVAAAFGAPVGGVLFSLEEGASFWNQALTWKIFFCSMISSFTLNVVQSYVRNHPWELSYPGLINFGTFTLSEYSGVELIIYMVMGAFGGIIGALFNFLNHKLTIFRQRYIKRNIFKVLETVIVSAVTAASCFLIIYHFQDCQPMREAPAQYNIQGSPLGPVNRQLDFTIIIFEFDIPVVPFAFMFGLVPLGKFFCEDGQYSASATMILQTPEEIVKNLFHEQTSSFSPLALCFICICYFFMSLWTYGLMIPSGLFIPCFLIGGAWGRIWGLTLRNIFPNQKFADPGKYALIGAAAMLGGVVRMTISLTVIIIEATANIAYGLPIMLTIIMAKWVGDFFNEGIYDIHIHLGGVPLLGWEPSYFAACMSASQVMSHPVTVLRTVETVDRIMHVLQHETHNGFPVVDDYDPYAPVERSNLERLQTFGTYRGIILRNQLLVLLKMKAFNEREDSYHTIRNFRNRDFREEYPRFQPIHKIHVSPQERKMHINLTHFLNAGAYTVAYSSTYPRIFRLFRALGLRHVTVIDHKHRVCGIVTRKDLARYSRLK